jgi:hypothetical protein
MSIEQALSACIERSYAVFGQYRLPPNVTICGFCYDPEQIEQFRSVPLRQLDLELSRLLSWEASDHFESRDVYKYYLPRILEYLAPPIRGEDIYPEHLFETLKAHDFHSWPAAERDAFWAYVVAVDQALVVTDPRAAREWRICAGRLQGSPYPDDGPLPTDEDPAT